ncbi:MAG TPA: BACON domain-containing carbohydrate-binding protein, partial [Verrucomicrobiae bacterium]|nr:BACON domain-containing carbohydrate-binding protein [Verrucomicrobiae bacterium]
MRISKGRRIATWAAWMLAAALGHAQPVLQMVSRPAPASGPATTLELGGPLAVDANGNLYALGRYRVYRIDPSGNATAAVGTGFAGFSDGGGVAVNAQIGTISDMTVDTDGSLYLSDATNSCIWRVIPSTGAISRFAWTGAAANVADSSAASVSPGSSTLLALDHKGNLYTWGSTGLRKTNLASGIITPVPVSETLVQSSVASIAINPTGSILYMMSYLGFPSFTYLLEQIDLCTGVASPSNLPIPAGSAAESLTFDPAGNLYLCWQYAIYKAPAGGGPAVEILGNSAPGLSGGLAAYGIAVDGSNNLYFVSGGQIWKSNTSGTTPVVFGGDQSSLSSAAGLAVDHNGNLYFSDAGSNRVRMLNLATGQVTTVAGGGSAYPGNGGAATSASLEDPTCLAVDTAGQNLYFVDTYNYFVRQVVLSTGIISTLVGGSNAPSGFSPTCLALDGLGNLYITSDPAASPHQFLKVTLATDQITTLAAPSNSQATIGSATGLAADASGDLFAFYTGQFLYRYVNGAWSLYAGSSKGQAGDTGDGGPASSATFNEGNFGGYATLALDGAGNLYISDVGNERIRRVQLSAGNIYPVTADPNGSVVQTLPANDQPLNCALFSPGAIATDSNGNLFIAGVFDAVQWDGVFLEAVNPTAIPASSAADTVAVAPATEGLAVAVDGVSVQSATVENWAAGSNHNLSAQASQIGQDGYTYSFAGWSDGNTSIDRSVMAGACPVTYTALYSVSPNCPFSLSATSLTAYTPQLQATTGPQNYSFNVFAPPGANCSWVAQASAPWILIANGSGSGPGVVSFTLVDYPKGQPRTGTITVAGLTFTITQQSDNGYVCAPFPPSFNTSSIYLPASNAFSGVLWENDSCSVWNVTSATSWLDVLSGSGTYVSGPVTYAAGNNSGSTPRMGSLTLPGNQTFTITQEPPGVDVVVLPAAVSAPANGASGSLTASPIDSNCAVWSASANVPWITITTPASGNSGAGTVNYSVAANNGAARQGTITVAGMPIAVSQAGSGNCRFSLASSSGTIPLGGGTGSFNLTASDAFCFWSASTSAAWLTVTSAGSGSAAVAYSATANANPGSATITIGGQTFTVNQVAGFPVTFATIPAGLQVLLDGSPVGSSPVNLSGSHSISVSGPQAGGAGTQYAFSQWSDGNTSNPRSINVTAAASYTADFTTQYRLTISASPAAGGTVNPSSGGFYNAGASVSVNATANNGYQFTGWTGSVANASSASTSIAMTAAETLTANFSPLTGITIQTNPTGLQFTVDNGTALTAPQTVNLPQGPHTIAVAATQAGTSGTQYVFGSWSDTGAASHSITVGSSAATYTATFTTQYQLTISASPAAGGTVTPASGGYYNSGASVPIAATPSGGYQFSNWTGSVAASASASTTVAMSAPETVTANFTALAAITIQTSPTGLQVSVDGGTPLTAPQTISLPPGQHTIAVQSTQTGPVGAPAGTQYVFSSWSDNGAASHSITVGATAATYTATFQTQYQLTISASPAAGGTVSP